MVQATNSILMIRPINFGYNEETAQDNHYQIKDSIIKNSNESAQKEFDNMVKNLRQNGISRKNKDNIWFFISLTFGFK